MQAWEMYYDELRRRAGPVAARRFDRVQFISEAAHEAYQRTADALAREHGWEGERALVLTRGLNEAVREWMGRGELDWDVLREQLRDRAAHWASAADPSRSDGARPRRAGGGRRSRDHIQGSSAVGP